jgi:peptide-methionine (S)-S-oxide reductase
MSRLRLFSRPIRVATMLAACLIVESLICGCKPAQESQGIAAEPQNTGRNATMPDDEKELGVATFGGGCFWCVEAVFQQLEGVDSVESGYAGGRVDKPTYKQVCAGTTGHAEVCQIRYDPSRVAYTDLLEVFFKTHDPTTLNRQGADFGTQYRSVVFYHTDRQKELAEKCKKELGAAGIWRNPIVTQIVPFGSYFKAEGYHQNFFNVNPENRYCQAVLVPKLEKLKKVFADKLKKEDAVGGN